MKFVNQLTNALEMKVIIDRNGKEYIADLMDPIDISIPLRSGELNVNAWYCPPVKIEPVIMDGWIGDVSQGGLVNFRNVLLNPHGNGTHTECVGHISKEQFTLNNCLKRFNFLSKVISITPQAIGDDLVITKDLIANSLTEKIEALIIRTNPNPNEKINKHYSNTNPPYIDSDAMRFIVSMGVNHLLIDLPSVDKEKDDGKLAAHHIFWNYPEDIRKDCTISELIYVPDAIDDGLYLLNLQITSLENDASPSKPVLYTLKNQ